MDHNQALILALGNVPTIITVLIGILLNNGRINDLNARMTGFETSIENRLTSIDGRMASIENRLTNLENKFDTRFDLLLSKVVELDNRLTRIETQRH